LAIENHDLSKCERRLSFLWAPRLDVATSLQGLG